MNRTEQAQCAQDFIAQCRRFTRDVKTVRDDGDDANDAIEVLIGDTWHTLRDLGGLSGDDDWLYEIGETGLVGFETDRATYVVNPVHIQAMRWSYDD